MAEDSVGATVYIPMTRVGEGLIARCTVILSKDFASRYLLKVIGGTIDEVEDQEARLVEDRMQQGRPVHQPILINMQPGGRVAGKSMTLGFICADRLAHAQQHSASLTQWVITLLAALAVKPAKAMRMIVFMVCWLFGSEWMPKTGRRRPSKVVLYATGWCHERVVIQVDDAVIKARAVLADVAEKRAALTGDGAPATRFLYITPKTGEEDGELRSVLSSLVDADIEVHEIGSLRELDRILRKMTTGKAQAKLSTAEKVDLCKAVMKVIKTLPGHLRLRRAQPQDPKPKEQLLLGSLNLNPEHEWHDFLQDLWTFGTDKERAAMVYRGIDGEVPITITYEVPVNPSLASPHSQRADHL